MAIDLYYTLLGAPSRAVIMTAKMVGVELNLKMVDVMAGDHLKPDFLKLNPQHKVPVLVDQGFVLTESRAICAYLVQKYASHDQLYPKHPQLRAAVDEQLYFDVDVFYSTFANYYYPVVFKGESQLNAEKEKLMKNAHKLLDSFLENKNFVAGNKLTIADISMLAGATSMEAAVDGLFEDYPNIKRWIELCKTKIDCYAELLNQVGADIFGQLCKNQLAKLDRH